MISFSCGHCGMKLKVKPEFAGRSSKCPLPNGARSSGFAAALDVEAVAAVDEWPGRFKRH